MKKSLPDLKVSPTMDDSVDRLSELPDPILHEILSFLPMREVAASMLLAKRWNHLWTTVPCLHFYCPKVKEDSLKFPKFVEEALKRWRGTKILQFSIDFQGMELDYDHDDVHSWVRFAVEKEVEELYLILNWIPCYLPDEVYSYSSLRKLSLHYLEVDDKESVNWNQLTSFTLVGSLNCCESVISKILVGSPLLEFLDLQTELICGDLKIKSTNLKTLKIYYGDITSPYDDDVLSPTVATVSAPILESVEFAGIRFTSCLLKVLSFDSDVILEVDPSWRNEIGEMFEDDVLGISHAVWITLNKWSLMLLVDVEMKEQTIVQFSNVKFLKICAVDAEGMLNVLEMFPELEMLIVERKEDAEYDPMECDLDIPQPSLQNLKKVEITWCIEDDNSITPVIKTILKDAPELHDMVVRLGKDGAGAELDLYDLRHVDAFL